MAQWGFLILPAVVLGVIAFPLLRRLLRYRREEFIRDYRWPAGLLERLEKQHGFERKDSALVSRGLRQFFLAYLLGGNRFVSMPSQVADDLWHEFILYTREYQNFCRKAFGGFLHHTPAVVLSADRKNNEGLRRVWWFCCKEENIDPVYPTRLPLLFALDAKFRIKDGFVYHPQCGSFGGIVRRRELPIAAATLRVRPLTEARLALAIRRGMAAAAMATGAAAVVEAETELR